MVIEFFAAGDPKPQGSAKGFSVGGKTRITTDNKGLKFWRECVANRAQDVAPMPLLDGEIMVMLDFFLPRPKSIPKRRIRPTVKPDIDKLTRAIFDALTHVIWTDDARVVTLSANKFYADGVSSNPGVLVKVSCV